MRMIYETQVALIIIKSSIYSSIRDNGKLARQMF